MKDKIIHFKKDHFCYDIFPSTATNVFHLLLANIVQEWYNKKYLNFSYYNITSVIRSIGAGSRKDKFTFLVAFLISCIVQFRFLL